MSGFYSNLYQLVPANQKLSSWHNFPPHIPSTDNADKDWQQIKQDKWTNAQITMCEKAATSCVDFTSLYSLSLNICETECKWHNNFSSLQYLLQLQLVVCSFVFSFLFTTKSWKVTICQSSWNVFLQDVTNDYTILVFCQVAMV